MRASSFSSYLGLAAAPTQAQKCPDVQMLETLRLHSVFYLKVPIFLCFEESSVSGECFGGYLKSKGERYGLLI